MRFSTLILLVCAAACTSGNTNAARPPAAAGSTENTSPVRVASAPGETHFKTLSQLTFSGENAEAYFSHDGKWITLQSTRDGRSCDQQYVMRSDGTDIKRVSDGR